MPITRMCPKKSELPDLEERLKWRRRTSKKLFPAFYVSLGLGTILLLPQLTQRTIPASDLMLKWGVFFCSLGGLLIVAHMRVWTLDTRDLSALLESDAITTVPILAEYHCSLSLDTHSAQTEKMRLLRTRVVDLLRAQSEIPRDERALSVSRHNKDETSRRKNDR
jgi:hypothetical protein